MSANVGEPIAREMTPLEIAWSRLRYWAIRVRRWFPFFVWWNDELDVTITFSSEKLTETEG